MSIYGGPHAAPDGSRVVVLDTETTGLCPVGLRDDGEPSGDPHGPDRLCSVAVVELLRFGDAWLIWNQTEFRVNPGRPVGEKASAVNGLVWRAEDATSGQIALEGYPTFSKLAGELLERIGDATVVCHNAAFDVAVLDAELVRAGRPPLGNQTICTKKAFSDMLGKGRPHAYAPGTSLNALCDLLGIDRSARLAEDGSEAPHSALVDAELTAKAFVWLWLSGWLLEEDPGELPHRKHLVGFGLNGEGSMTTANTTPMTMAEAIAASEGQPLPGDLLLAQLPPDFTRLVLERWLHENHIEAHEGPWLSQSTRRMSRAIRYALGAAYDE